LLLPGFDDSNDTMTATDNQMVDGVERATQALVPMDNAPLALHRRESVTSRVGSWQPLLEKLQLFKDVVDKIAEVCYLAKYISSSLSHIPWPQSSWSVFKNCTAFTKSFCMFFNNACMNHCRIVYTKYRHPRDYNAPQRTVAKGVFLK